MFASIKSMKSKKALIIIVIVAIIIAALSTFFDQSILVHKGTFYHGSSTNKIIALTFDDGPSQEWTPGVLQELKKAGIKATFFMVGEHVDKYPNIAKAVAADGHEIGNHTYNHQLVLTESKATMEEQIRKTEKSIMNATGARTVLFRPPKAWLTDTEKQQINDMGYEVVLWSVNSKDWVTFDDKYIVSYINRVIKPGDIILFHDAGGVFSPEGGNRHETVKTLPRLIKKLKDKGYSFVTVSELKQCLTNSLPDAITTNRNE